MFERGQENTFENITYQELTAANYFNAIIQKSQ